MAAYTEISVSLTDSNVKTFLEGKENQYSKRKTEMYVLSGFNNNNNNFSRLRAKIGNWKIYHRPMWPFTWKITSVVKMNENEN